MSSTSQQVEGDDAIILTIIRAREVRNIKLFTDDVAELVEDPMDTTNTRIRSHDPKQWEKLCLSSLNNQHA